MRHVMVKAQIVNAFAITGRFAFTYPYTQGNALGYVLNFGWCCTKVAFISFLKFIRCRSLPVSS